MAEMSLLRFLLGPLVHETGSRQHAGAPMVEDLLLEIGVEELPASFVTQAVAALPTLIEDQLRQVRLSHGAIWASGTPRRLVVRADGLAMSQPDLDEEMVGPPSRAGFDAKGNPTKAAEAFAQKLGCPIAQLGRVMTPKGEYLVGRRREQGVAAQLLLPKVLERVCASIPFRKSMRWANEETAFGRPVRWLLALIGTETISFSFAGISAGRTTEGHRFLARSPVEINHASEYVAALRARHVLVDTDERRRVMQERLEQAAKASSGTIIADEFLVGENCSLVEDPCVVVGSFESEFLELPEGVILAVARGHQRYFGMRDCAGKLLPKYLAVVGTAENPGNITRGGDRVMRARLADARFFHLTDLARPLAARREQLDSVMFHKRLGSVGDKVRRLEQLIPRLAAELNLSEQTRDDALTGAGLAKCDLVSLMVGELPELQGDVGRSYALAQGVSPSVADVIAEHYQPRGADDPTAKHEAGALVAIADRLDTLVGCFAIGQVPTGAADPLALRRSTLGVLRTLLDQGWDLSLGRAIELTYAGFEGTRLDQPIEATSAKLLQFFRDRLKGLLTQSNDVIEACLQVAADRPCDARDRAIALEQMPQETRASVGEVIKRAANIAKEAPVGALVAPRVVATDVHPSEQRLFQGLGELAATIEAAESRKDYPAGLAAIAEFAPLMAQFFSDVFVMVDDSSVRDNRLRLMRDIHRSCSKLANFDLLASRKGV